jgi:hypothetical protein
MITTDQFSKKLILVITLLIGLRLLNVAYPLITSLLLNENSTSVYSLIYFTGNLLFGVVLVLQQRLHVLTTISIVLLAIFYPVFAALIYLVTLISSAHEQ